MVENVKVAGVILRITYLNKIEDSTNHWWTGIVEKLDITEQGEIADLDGNRTIYAQGENEGPIVNTGFIYYPLTKTIALHKKVGGVNDKNFGVFIRKLLRQTKIVEKGSSKYIMDVLPDLNKLDRLYNSKHIKELKYSFLLPKDLSANQSEKRSIWGDFRLAKKLGGERMNVTITASEMNADQTKRKVKQILEMGNDHLSSLRAVTEHDDIEEPLDLLTNKFSDYKDIDLKKGKKETPTLIMDTINEIFIKQKKLIQTMYINDEDE